MATVQVQMLETISGSHASGQPWPVAGEIAELDDWEAEHVIRGGMARPVDAPVEPEVPAGPEVPEEPLPEEPAPSGEIPVAPPKAIQPKADWVAWAVVNGLPEDDANALTKAELMEQYGARA